MEVQCPQCPNALHEEHALKGPLEPWRSDAGTQNRTVAAMTGYNAKAPAACSICGRASRRACGLLEHAGRCGLPDPRKSDLKGLGEPLTSISPHNPMNQMSAARAALAALRPCGAHARTTGQPCQRPPCRGSTRCHLHGGRSTGAPVTNGRRTLKRQRADHYVTLLTKTLSLFHTKPAPQLVAQDPAGRWRAVEPDGFGGYRFIDDTNLGGDEAS